MTHSHIYCFRSGHIHIGQGRVPDGALPIRLRASQDEIDTVIARARHGWQKDVLLVPGIPEADTDEEAYEAFEKFVAWLDFTPHKAKAAQKTYGGSNA